MIIYIMYNHIRTQIIKNPSKNIVFKMVNRLFIDKYQPPKLGRWGLLNKEQLDNRVDWSNEDHCGPCGSLILDKRVKKETS